MTQTRNNNEQRRPAGQSSREGVKRSQEQEAASEGGGRKQKGILIGYFSDRFGIDAELVLPTLKDTAFRQSDGKEITNSQMIALLVIAREHQLNPFTRQIYAFPSKGGGIHPIVSVDGWIQIINSHPMLQYLEFESADDDNSAGLVEIEDYWVRTIIKRKDREKPTRIMEYWAECARKTDPWDSHPRRMTRHKSLIQCGRVAMGYTNFLDPDEAARIIEGQVIGEPRIARESRKPVTREPQALENKPNVAGGQLQGIELQRKQLVELIDRTGVPAGEVLTAFDVADLEQLKDVDVKDAIDLVERLKP